MEAAILRLSDYLAGDITVQWNLQTATVTVKTAVFEYLILIGNLRASFLILTINLQGSFYHPNFADEETKVF